MPHRGSAVFTAEEQRLLAQKKSNPLRAYLGLSDAEQTRIQKRDALIDRDLYSDLRRCVPSSSLDGMHDKER